MSKRGPRARLHCSNVQRSSLTAGNSKRVYLLQISNCVIRFGCDSVCSVDKDCLDDGVIRIDRMNDDLSKS